MKAANLSLVTTRTNWIHSWAGCIFNKDRLTSSIITHLCEMAIWNHGPACTSHLGITIGFIHAFGERPCFPSSCFLRIRNFMLVSHCFLFAKLACYYRGDVLVMIGRYGLCGLWRLFCKISFVQTQHEQQVVLFHVQFSCHKL